MGSAAGRDFFNFEARRCIFDHDAEGEATAGLDFSGIGADYADVGAALSARGCAVDHDPCALRGICGAGVSDRHQIGRVDLEQGDIPLFVGADDIDFAETLLVDSDGEICFFAQFAGFG